MYVPDTPSPRNVKVRKEEGEKSGQEQQDEAT
jgi:hypothetical protein